MGKHPASRLTQMQMQSQSRDDTAESAARTHEAPPRRRNVIFLCASRDAYFYGLSWQDVENGRRNTTSNG